MSGPQGHSAKKKTHLGIENPSQATRPVEFGAPFSDRSLPVGLLRAREAVMAHMRPILRSHGTTEQQWRVLRALNEKTPLDKTSLAYRAALLMPSLLRILKDLKRAGLIRLVRSTTNARLSGVILTAAGGHYVQKVTLALADMGRVIRTAIGEDVAEQLLDLLSTVEARLIDLKRQSEEEKN